MNVSTDRPGDILISQDEAARRLGISEKTLWNYTFPRGPLVSVRIGARRLYSPITLQKWVESQEAAAMQ